jgi:hypothetical protein
VLQTAKILGRFLLFPLGSALLSAALLIQGGTALSTAPQTMPTPDRLAQPTLPTSPSQADYGAQEFWFQCLPCHGDRGQGLTEEFRETYPSEDRNCWESGCHGERPYENGWTIPQIVTPLIGAGSSLEEFSNAKTLHDFICAAMPYQWPGTLEDEPCWKLTAFLLRENGIAYSGELNGSNAYQIRLMAWQPVPTVTPLSPTPPISASADWAVLSLMFLLGGILVFRIAAGHHAPPQ